MEPGKRAVAGWQALLEAHLGSAGATLVWTLIWVAGAVLALVYARYVGVLGAGDAAEGSRERQTYDDLRASLSDGGSPTRIYGRLLTRFLDGVGQFFRDHDKAHLGIFRHAFGLRGTYPLWTAAAFDRCLLLALIYPMLCIIIIWTISGHVGSVENAFGLATGAPGWRRSVVVGGLAVSVTSLWRFPTVWNQVRTLHYIALLFTALVPFVIIVFLGAGVGAGTFVTAVCIAILVSRGGVGAVPMVGRAFVAGDVVSTGAVAVAVVVVMIASPPFLDAIAASASAAAAAAVAVAAAVGGGAVLIIVSWLSVMLARRSHQGAFLCVFGGVMVALVIALARWSSFLSGWAIIGPTLLFLGLLTLLNAPFDWVSLGLTRALLHRGVELRGWWPYGFALVDFILAVVIVVFLAGTMVIGIQAFDLSATNPVLPLGPLFDSLAKHPGDPVNWWVYALLLSTLIPSLINLVIASASLTRGVPGVSTLLLRSMPEGAAVLTWDRAWIAAVLTVQWAVGGTLMLASFAALGWLVAMLVPEAGTWFLDYARAVADLDLPRHAWGLIGH